MELNIKIMSLILTLASKSSLPPLVPYRSFRFPGLDTCLVVGFVGLGVVLLILVLELPLRMLRRGLSGVLNVQLDVFRLKVKGSLGYFSKQDQDDWSKVHGMAFESMKCTQDDN